MPASKTKTDKRTPARQRTRAAMTAVPPAVHEARAITLPGPKPEATPTPAEPVAAASDRDITDTAEGELAPDEREARARLLLALTAEELAGLNAQRSARAERFAAAERDLAEAHAQRDALATEASLMPARIEQAKVALGMAVGTPTEEARRTAIEALEQRQHVTLQRLAEASERIVTQTNTLAQLQTALHALDVSEDQERHALELRVAAIHAEIAAARRAAAAALLAELQAESAQHRARLEAAEAAVATARADLEAFTQTAREQLRAHAGDPDIAAALGELGLRQTPKAERALAAYAAFLDTCLGPTGAEASPAIAGGLLSVADLLGDGIHPLQYLGALRGEDGRMVHQRAQTVREVLATMQRNAAAQP